MAEARRKCDDDFREGAVRTVRETGKPIAQVARELRQRGHPGELGDAGRASAGHRERGTGGGRAGRAGPAAPGVRGAADAARDGYASYPDADQLGVERALELAARLHAARAASAAAAAALMTLGLPIAASATARSTTIPAMLMVWACGQAALASAWAMAAERPAFSSSVDWESVRAPVTAVNASASASASRSAMPRSSLTSVMMRPIVT